MYNMFTEILTYNVIITELNITGTDQAPYF